MVRRIPIRVKIAGALAVPLLGLAAAVGLGVRARSDEAAAVARQVAMAEASIGHAGLIDALQTERNLAVVEVLGLGDQVDIGIDLPGARDAVDQAQIALRNAVSSESTAVRERYIDALGTLSDLAAMRDQVDRALTDPGIEHLDLAHEVFAGYTAIIGALFSSHDRFAVEIDDPAIRHGADLVHRASHAADAAAGLIESLVFLGSGPDGLDTMSEAAAVAGWRRELRTDNAALRAGGTGRYAPATRALFDDPRVEGLPALADEALEAGGPVESLTVFATAPLDPDNGYAAYRRDVVAELSDVAAELREDADAQQRRYLGGALAIVALALFVAWWVSRSITRPLGLLSRQARATAAYRLPAAVAEVFTTPPGEDVVVPALDPIGVRSRDEVGDVAGAFTDVQDSALELAVEQAALRRNVLESYVNLGRRNQNLLSRLIDVVGELEEDEDDPRRLRRIHKLDHLATRVRRNAESLLVLCRADEGVAWRPPLPVADVVRSALDEIEGYDRVVVRSLDPAWVLGGTAPDLAHLLAELLENGLRHSPPRELVEVTGRVAADRYVLSLVDHGLGMSAEEIERANQRLAGDESFTVTPAKYLGHYVTAVLAARHRIRVELEGSLVVGITARVELPAELLTDEPAPPGPPGDPASVGEAAPIPTTGASGGRAHLRAPGWLDWCAERDGRRRDVPVGRPPLGAAGTPGRRPGGGGTAAPAERHRSTRVARALAAGARPVAELPAALSTTVAEASLVVPGVPAPEDAGDAAPPRTPSGLVRRVPGTHIPRAADGGPPEEATPAPPRPVDGEGMRDFLTSIAGGVQRSLDDRASARTDHEG